MIGVGELAPALGVAAACQALGLWRGQPARERLRLWQAQLIGPPTPPAPRARSPLALEAAENQALLATLNSERFADSAPASVYATLLDEGRYLGSVRTMYRVLAANGSGGERPQATHPSGLQQT